jgi:putative membrane protein
MLGCVEIRMRASARGVGSVNSELYRRQVVTAMWHMNDLGWGWWLLMSVGMVAFWVLVIYGIVWLARSASSSAPPAATRPADESPQQTLKRRLAAGDISVEQYERVRAVLEDDRPHAPPPAAVR